MKKRAKAKATKTVMPDLVTAMMKLVERLEVLERKVDQVSGRVANLPTEVRRAVQDVHPPQPFHHTPPAPRPGQGPQQSQGPRERILYQAICADCSKRCEVPFKPSGDRPVYCPECFAIRKAGHVPKDLTSHVVVPQHMRDLKAAPVVKGKTAVASKSKKTAKKTSKKTKKKK